MERSDTIQRIKAALRRRSGKVWSVTGGRGTAWGWLRINAPPARRTWRQRPLAHNPGGYLPGPENWEPYDSGEPGHNLSPAERLELVGLLGFSENDGRHVGDDGVSVPASHDYWREYIDRAEGRKPTKLAEPYWD